MFWGLEVKPKKAFTQTPPVTTKLAQVTLGPNAKPGKSVLICKVDNVKYAICTLCVGKVEQASVDLVFGKGETVTFYALGENSISVSGYYITDDVMFDEESEEDSFAEKSFDFDELDHGATDLETEKNTQLNVKVAAPVSDTKKSLGDLFGKKKKTEVSLPEEDDEEDDDYVPSGSEEGDHEIPEDDDDEENEEEESYYSDEEEEEEVASVAAQLQAKKRAREDASGPQRKKAKGDNGAPVITVTEPTPQKKKKKKKENDANATQQKKDAGKKEKKEKGKLLPPKSAMQKRKLKNGLEIIDYELGSKKKAVPGKTVVVNYVGKLTNGMKFDSGVGLSFRLGAKEVIPGWDQGLVGMMRGGKRTLIVPPHLAYGKEGAAPIPPNATLVFDVELTKC